MSTITCSVLVAILSELPVASHINQQNTSLSVLLERVASCRSHQPNFTTTKILHCAYSWNGLPNTSRRVLLFGLPVAGHINKRTSRQQNACMRTLGKSCQLRFLGGGEMWLPKETCIFILLGLYFQLVVKLEQYLGPIIDHLMDWIFPCLVRQQPRQRLLVPLGFQDKGALTLLLMFASTMSIFWGELAVSLNWQPMTPWRFLVIKISLVCLVGYALLTMEAFCFLRLTKMQFTIVIMWLLMFDFIEPYREFIYSNRDC